MVISEVDGITARFFLKMRFLTELLGSAGTVPVVREEWMKVTRQEGPK